MLLHELFHALLRAAVDAEAIAVVDRIKKEYNGAEAAFVENGATLPIIAVRDAGSPAIIRAEVNQRLMVKPKLKKLAGSGEVDVAAEEAAAQVIEESAVAYLKAVADHTELASSNRLTPKQVARIEHEYGVREANVGLGAGSRGYAQVYKNDNVGYSLREPWGRTYSVGAWRVFGAEVSKASKIALVKSVFGGPLRASLLTKLRR